MLRNDNRPNPTHPVHRPIASAPRLIALAVLAPLTLLAAGCATQGPVTIRNDRFNFNEAGARSTNEQILLNIVRLRYGEPIYFVDVGSMLSQYSLAAGGSVGGSRNSINQLGPIPATAFGVDPQVTGVFSMGADVRYTDSPTITYNPLSGEEFAQRVMARIPLATILDLAMSGWDIERLLECCVQRMNGLANKPMHDVHQVQPHSFERFQRAAQLLQIAQDAEVLRFNIEVEASDQAIYLYPPPVPKGMENTRREFRELLDLPAAGVEKLKLTPDAVRREPDELAIQTRSVLGAMYALAQEISVPESHLAKCRPTSGPADDSAPLDPAWLRVEHSRIPQPGAFVQVAYRDYWFYVADDDWKSKRTLSLLTYLFSLQSSTKAQTAPVITVPAGK